MQIHRDIPYVQNDDDAKHTFDIYLPDVDSGKAPLAIYIHGGAWRTGDKSELHNLGEGLVRQSQNRLAVAIINYRLTVRSDASTRHPMHICDTLAAVKHLIVASDYPGSDLVDKDNVYLVGHSAGAHLATLLVLQHHPDFALTRNIKGVLGVGGIYDLAGLVKTYPTYSDFVDMAFDKAQYDAASPQFVAQTKFEGAEHVRFLVLNSTADELMGSGHSMAFASQLVESKYSDVTVVVRNIGTHFGELDSEEFWQIVVDFVFQSRH
ncbi:alpha/beta-hydrolase [Martensiomyces pterosporus]|nr:alpha/beta-hydrolase [Martensiomyces pterosporus]